MAYSKFNVKYKSIKTKLNSIIKTSNVIYYHKYNVYIIVIEKLNFSG